MKPCLFTWTGHLKNNFFWICVFYEILESYISRLKKRNSGYKIKCWLLIHYVMYIFCHIFFISSIIWFNSDSKNFFFPNLYSLENTDKNLYNYFSDINPYVDDAYIKFFWTTTQVWKGSICQSFERKSSFRITFFKKYQF